MFINQKTGNVEGDKNQLFQNIHNSNIDMSRTTIFSIFAFKKTIFVDSIKDINISFKTINRNDNLFFIFQMILMLMGAFIWVIDVPFPIFFSSLFFNSIFYFFLLVVILFIMILPLLFLEFLGFGIQEYEIKFQNGKFGGKNILNNFVTKQAQYIRISSVINDENFLFEFKNRLEADKFFILLNH